MKTLRNITAAADIIVFVCTTLAVAGVFYEGMTQKWYDFVGVLVFCMDYSFLPTTVLHLAADKKDRRIIPHIISALLLAAAVVMKLAGMDYPAWSLVLWYFYIWFLYGTMLAKRFFQRPADRDRRAVHS